MKRRDTIKIRKASFTKWGWDGEKPVGTNQKRPEYPAGGIG